MSNIPHEHKWEILKHVSLTMDETEKDIVVYFICKGCNCWTAEIFKPLSTNQK